MRKEIGPLFNEERILVTDNESPDQLIFGKVDNVQDQIRDGVTGAKVSVKSIDGRTFEFSTLLRIGSCRFTSRDNRYIFYRASFLDPQDQVDQEIIKKAIKAAPQILKGNGHHTP